MGGFRRSRIGILCLALWLAACGGGSSQDAVFSGPAAMVPTGRAASAPDGPAVPVDEQDARRGDLPAKEDNGSGLFATKPYVLPGSVVNVGVASVTPAVINATLYEGSKLPDIVLYGTGQGDLSLLAGKTLYVYIEDPSGIFGPQVDAYPVSSPAPGLAVWLWGTPQLRAGSFKGELRIHVCLDAGCASRLRAVHVPFHVDVLRGYRRVDQASLDGLPAMPIPLAVGSTFGEPSPTASLVLVPPERAPVSSLYATFSPDDGWDNTLENKPRTNFTANADGTVTLNVTFPPQLTPGKRTATLHLSSSNQVGVPPSWVPSTMVKFTSTVTPNAAVPVAFSPASLAISIPVNVSRRPTHTIRVAAGDPAATLQYEGVEALYTATQQGLLPPGGWGQVLSASNVGGWSGSPLQYVFPASCPTWFEGEGPAHSACLPPGSYAFRLRYRHELGGVPTTIYYPVQLTVTP